MSDDVLISEFTTSRSENAFQALVLRHLNLVYSTALRQLGDAGLAEEVTQDVFLTLARKSSALTRYSTVAGWLYQATLLAAKQRLRSELRRMRREKIAVALGTTQSEDTPWGPLVPLLDEALMSLRETDRLAVVLRFLEGKSLREVGQALGVSEDAAQNSVGRSVPEVAQFLWKSLRSQEQPFCQLALSGLQRYGFEPEDIPVLAEMLASTQDLQLKRNIPRALGDALRRNGDAAAPFIENVERLLDDADSDVRFGAASALAVREGAVNPKAFEEIAASLKGSDKVRRSTVAYVLFNAGSGAKPWLNELKDLAQSLPQSPENDPTRELALRTIFKINPELRNEIPQLDRLLEKDENRRDWDLKWSTAQLSVQELTTGLNDQPRVVAAASRLGELDAAASSAVPSMVASLAGQSEEIRDKIVEAIHRIDPKAVIDRVEQRTLLGAWSAARMAYFEKRSENPTLAKIFNVLPFSWWTQPELVSFANKLAVEDRDVHHAFVEKVTQADARLQGLFQPGS